MIERTLNFFEEEHLPDVTEAFQLLPRQHLSLHHNAKDDLVAETGAVELTPAMTHQSCGYKPHQTPPPLLGFTPGTHY